MYVYITHFEQVTAKRAISQVVFSRIVMAVPGMGMFIHTTVHMRDMVQVVYTLSSYSAIHNEPPRKEELLQGIHTGHAFTSISVPVCIVILQRMPWANAPLQVLLVGLWLVVPPSPSFYISMPLFSFFFTQPDICYSSLLCHIPSEEVRRYIPVHIV